MTNIHPAYLASLRPHRVVVAEVIGLPRWRHRKVLWVAPRVARPWWVALQQCQAGRTHLSVEGDRDAVFNPCAGYVWYFYYLDIPWYTQIILDLPGPDEENWWTWWKRAKFHSTICWRQFRASQLGTCRALAEKNLLGCQLLDDMNWYDNIWLIYYMIGAMLKHIEYWAL